MPWPTPEAGALILGRERPRGEPSSFAPSVAHGTLRWFGGFEMSQSTDLPVETGLGVMPIWPRKCTPRGGLDERVKGTRRTRG